MRPGALAGLGDHDSVLDRGRQALMTTTPFDLVVSRLEAVRGTRPKLSARCPGHCDRGPSLSLREVAGGKLLLHCFAGCEAAKVMAAIGLELRDLTPRLMTARDDRTRRQFAKGRAFEASLATAPSYVVDAAIAAETEAAWQRAQARAGFEMPLSSRIVNEARALVGKRYAKKVKRIAPFSWERCFPHCEDPLWPVLFERALNEEVRRRWHLLFPDAPPGDSDPRGPFLSDVICAEERAAFELHEIARRGGV